MAKNRQQVLKERRKQQALEQRQAEKQKQKRLDLVDHMTTFVYDRIISRVLLPFIQKEFKFTEEKTELFRSKLAEHEVYNEMYRTHEPVDVKRIREWRPDDKGYRMMIQYTIEKVREILWFIGYTESQLKKKYDVKLPPFPEWDDLFKEEVTA